VDELTAANGLTDGEWIFAGGVLIIPSAAAAWPTAPPAPSGTATPAAAPVAPARASVAATTAGVRTGPSLDYPVLSLVQAGETYDIVGRDPAGGWWRICCPAAEGAGWILAELVTVTGEPRIYVVQAGDNLFRIGQRFGLTAEELVVANWLADRWWISVGQDLFIPAPGTPLDANVYVVQPGDTLSSIAMRLA